MNEKSTRVYMTGKGNKGFIKLISDFRRSAALAALCVLLVISAAGCGTADSQG